MIIRISGNKIAIVGGLGPETSSKFLLNINNRFRKLTNCQPDIMMINVPVPSSIESKMINGETCKEMFDLLAEAVIRLNNAEVDFLVIPCNTVHVFIEDLREISEKPMLSIIEECAKECKKRDMKKVGILATTKSVREKLHIKELEKQGTKTIVPDNKDQEKVSKIIIKIIHNKTKIQDKKTLLNIIRKLKQEGAEAVILGCTDLFLVVKKACLPLINTTKVLEDSVMRILVSERN